LCVRSAASPVCLLLIAKSLRENGLLLDYRLNDAALLQALFSHAFDAARIAVPIDTALKNLNQLLGHLQRGGENVVFAAPVAFGLAHDLAPALNTVTEQIVRLQAELGARQIDRQSLRQVADNLRRAESRFKVCRSRLQSIATLFKHTRARRERCYLNSVVDEVHEWLTPELVDHGVVFDFARYNRVKDDSMHADTAQLFQVIYNLVSNASKALRTIPKEKRRIEVRTFQPEQSRLILLRKVDIA
jgi:light-regulated signal transduction histidine kinase (bacteriophytochrome)